MSKFLDFLKKFLKWAVIIAVGFIAITFIVVKYNDYQNKIAYTVYEEFGLVCAEAGKRNTTLIVQANPYSRKTEKYWYRFNIVFWETSELDPSKGIARFEPFMVTERDVDFVIASRSNYKFKVNRETYAFTAIEDNKEAFTKACEVADADNIRQLVIENNKNVPNIL